MANKIDRWRMSKEQGAVTRAQWNWICEHYGWLCVKCGKPGKLHMDHIVPVSKGGTYSPDNVQPLCSVCNLSKKDSIADYRPDKGKFLSAWDPEAYRQCIKCGAKQSEGAEFYRNSNICRKCKYAYSVEWKKKNNPGYSPIGMGTRSSGISYEEYTEMMSNVNNAPDAIKPKQWKEMCRHYGMKCVKCGNVDVLVKGSVVPISRGGRRNVENIQPLCEPCSRRVRGDGVDYRPDKGAYLK